MDLSPNALVVANERGGKQSLCPASFVDGFPHAAILRVAQVVHEGGLKYGAENWKNVSRGDHLNHALVHLFALLAGDTQDAHLDHAATRILFALESE